jgi:hypothetical protein
MIEAYSRNRELAGILPSLRHFILAYAVSYTEEEKEGVWEESPPTF